MSEEKAYNGIAVLREPNKVDMATISFVVAVAEDGAMGKGNGLPWHLPNDFQFFKCMTVGKPILMGRKTWESLGGKALPKRTNVVLSSHNLELPEGVMQFKDVDEALAHFQDEHEICIIGGAQIFESTLPKADVLHLTRVHTIIPDADTYFPEVDWNEWKLTWKEDHEPDERHKYGYTFQRWERKEG